MLLIPHMVSFFSWKLTSKFHSFLHLGSTDVRISYEGAVSIHLTSKYGMFVNIVAKCLTDTRGISLCASYFAFLFSFLFLFFLFCFETLCFVGIIHTVIFSFLLWNFNLCMPFMTSKNTCIIPI